MRDRFIQRFKELLEQGKQLEASRRYECDEDSGSQRETVDGNAFTNWKVKAKNLLLTLCNEDSPHVKTFDQAETMLWSNYLDRLRRMMAILDAAREDFEGGYLDSIHALVQAEVFDSELEQATELLDSGYASAAAVIAGVVLETALRDLCSRNNIAYGKMDKMNADLAKAQVYSILVQKQVTHLARIRNAAAHGNHSQFQPQDVTGMIAAIQQFLVNHLS